jgi:hypothetical protein
MRPHGQPIGPPRFSALPDMFVVASKSMAPSNVASWPGAAALPRAPPQHSAAPLLCCALLLTLAPRARHVSHIASTWCFTLVST